MKKETLSCVHVSHVTVFQRKFTLIWKRVNWNNILAHTQMKLKLELPTVVPFHQIFHSSALPVKVENTTSILFSMDTVIHQLVSQLLMAWTSMLTLLVVVLVWLSQSTTRLLIMLKWVTRKPNHTNPKSQRILLLSSDGLANHHVNHFNFDSGDRCSCWSHHLVCSTCGTSAPGLVWRIPTMSRLKTLENSNNNFPLIYYHWLYRLIFIVITFSNYKIQ